MGNREEYSASRSETCFMQGDSAKRENPANNAAELQLLRRKYDKRDYKNCHIRPLFFRYVDTYKGYRDEYYIYEEEDGAYKRKLSGVTYSTAKEYRTRRQEQKAQGENIGECCMERGRMAYRMFHTTMDYLQKSIDRFRYERQKEEREIPFAECLIDKEETDGRIYYYQVEEIIEAIRNMRKRVNAIWTMEGEIDSAERRSMVDQIHEEMLERLKTLTLGKATLLYLLSLLDKREYSDIRTYLFYGLFRMRNKEIYELVRESRRPIWKVEECADENREFVLYDFSFRKVPA